MYLPLLEIFPTWTASNCGITMYTQLHILLLKSATDLPEQQMKHPTRQPKLLNLRSFTVSHHHVQLRHEVNELCKWVRRAIAGSPIEELKFISENDPDNFGSPSSCFTGLLEHIVKKQFSTMRILDLGSAFVCVDHLRSLLIACVRLEELKLSVSRNALASFFFPLLIGVNLFLI